MKIYLNLPTEIYWEASKKIQYLYNAAGQKLKKTVIDANTIKNVDYLDGFQYAGGILQFFPHAEGYIKATPQSNTPNGEPTSYTYNYAFNYTDHLGNVRVSYSKDPATNQLKILEENHYYPFGLKHSAYDTGSKRDFMKGIDPGEPPVRIENVLETEYQYKYNGKELQDELGLNMYDYGWRQYDPAIARWVVADALSEEYSSWSPYNYATNNPTYFIDPNGLWVDDYQLNQDGSVELLQKTNDKSDTLYASNADGSVNYDKSVTVEKASASDGSVISGLSESRGYMANQKNQSGYKEGDGDVSFGYTNNVNDAVNVFNFLNANTSSNIEFGLMRFEKNGSDDNYLVGTQHSVDRLGKAYNSMISYIGGNSNLISFFHNHDGAVGAAGANLGISIQWGSDQSTRRSVHKETLKNSNMLSRFFTVHEGGGNSLIELNRFGASKTGMTMTPGTVSSINKINYNDVKE